MQLAMARGKQRSRSLTEGPTRKVRDGPTRLAQDQGTGGVAEGIGLPGDGSVQAATGQENEFQGPADEDAHAARAEDQLPQETDGRRRVPNGVVGRECVRDETLIEPSGSSGPEPLLPTIGPSATDGPVERPGFRLVHHPDKGEAVMEDGNRDGVQRKPAGVVDGAVEWIDDPAIGCTPSLESGLFAEYGMRREMVADGLENRHFGRQVGFGDDIAAGLELGLDRLRPEPAERWPGGPRRLLGHAKEMLCRWPDGFLRGSKRGTTAATILRLRGSPRFGTALPTRSRTRAGQSLVTVSGESQQVLRTSGRFLPRDFGRARDLDGNAWEPPEGQCAWMPSAAVTSGWDPP